MNIYLCPVIAAVAESLFSATRKCCGDGEGGQRSQLWAGLRRRREDVSAAASGGCVHGSERGLRRQEHVPSAAASEEGRAGL